VTAPAVTTSAPPAPIEVPAVASLAVRAIVAGPSRRASVLGSSTHAVWVGLGNDVVVLNSRDAVRLPNSLEIPSVAAQAPFARMGDVRSAWVGSGTVSVGDVMVRVARWWDPRAILQPSDQRALRRRMARLGPVEPTVDSAQLVRAIRLGDPGGLLRAAGALLGLGGGLTPEGDDLVAGSFAGLCALGPALGSPGVAATVHAIGPPLVAMACARTTTFSASLLRHAVHGEVAAPAAAFLHALTGRGDPVVAQRRLVAVGHTSGAALAAGILLAARTLIEGEDT
jgi:hypothetical protein